MNFWDELFASGNASGASARPAAEPVELRVLRKHGRPLLLLPSRPRLAIQCLDLYPAQTGQARFARTVLRFLWRCGVFVKTERVQVGASGNDPFTQFLTSTAGSDKGRLPEFGVLAGNPAGGTQRFIILLFDPGGEPAAIVKAGVAPAARELIQKEKAFLAGVPPKTRGIPQFRSSFESAGLEAFAMNFFPGESPGPQDDRFIQELLTSWINPNGKRPLRGLPQWIASEKMIAPTVADRTREQVVHTAIQHGDFAPWNIKVAPNGSWTALDWERGNLNGIPAWDWFHYVIQTNILVRKRGTEDLIQRVEQLLSSAPFKAYAEKAGISGMERSLLQAYLAHLIEVIKPAEGLEENRALLQALLAFDKASFRVHS
jgi:hypothetical protein